MRFKCLVPLVVGVAVSSIALPEAAGADKVWGALVLASQVEDPKEPPKQLVSILPRLRKVFGYNHFEILGSATTEIEENVERWLRPSEHFALYLKGRRASGNDVRGGYLMNLQLYQDKRALVDTWAKLAPASPLVIRGPMHARGQILIVLQVQPR